MDFIGIRLIKVEARKEREGIYEGFNLNITITGVIVEKKDVVIKFVYTAKYEPDVGSIVIEGDAFAREEEKQAKKMAEQWKKEGKLSNEITEPILNLINYAASAEGMLFAKSMNLPPTMVPPRITIEKEKK